MAARGAEFEPARYVGGTRTSAKPFEQSHLVMAFAGPSYGAAGVLCRPGVLGPVRRGHVIAAVPGGARAPRPLLCDLFELLGAGRYGPVRHSRRDGAGDDGQADRRGAASSSARAAAEKPAEAEVARSKAQLKAGLLMGLESSSARAEQMARQLLLFDRLIDTVGDRRAHRGGDAGGGARAGGEAGHGQPPSVAVVGAGRKGKAYARAGRAHGERR